MLGAVDSEHSSFDSDVVALLAALQHLKEAGLPAPLSDRLDDALTLVHHIAGAWNVDRLGIALEGSQGGIWDMKLDPDSDTLPDEIYLSPRLKSFIGFEDHEFPNSMSAWKARVLEEDHAAIDVTVQAHIGGELPILETQYRIRHRDGSLRWIHSRGKIYRDAQGRPVRWAGVDWDITERKLSEDSMRASEERFRLLAENSPDIIYIVDVTKPEVIYMNRDHFLGYTREELIAQRPLTLTIHPDDWPAVRDRWMQIIADNTEFDRPFEYRVVRKDGGVEWIRSREKIMRRDAQGQPQHLLLNFTIITDYRLIQEARQRSEELLRITVSNLPVVLFMIDKDGVFTLIEGKGLEKLGMKPGEMVGLPVLKVARHLPEALADLRRAMDGESFSAVHQVQGLFFETFFTALRAANGQPDGVLGLSIDVTEHTRMLRALEESERRSSAIVDSLPDLIMRLDAEGYFRYLRPPKDNFSSVTWEEVEGKTIEQVYDRKDAIGLRAVIKQAVSTREPQIFTYTVTPEEFEREAYIIALDEDDVWMFVRDVTHRKLAAQHQLEKERSRLLKALIDDTSHDLRTPVSTLMTSTYLLRRHIDRFLDDVLKLVNMLAEIENEALDNLITDLGQTAVKITERADSLEDTVTLLRRLIETATDMARLNSGNTAYNFTRCQANDLVQTMVKLVAPLAEEKRLRLVFHPPNKPLLVIVDEDEMRRVLQNLIENAITFTPEGGRIDVRVLQRDHTAIIEVQDNGVGIAQKDLPHIFDRLYRADKARTRIGMGLGLAIAKKIVEIHQGEIEVESVVGEGSTFRIKLPLHIA